VFSLLYDLYFVFSLLYDLYFVFSLLYDLYFVFFLLYGLYISRFYLTEVALLLNQIITMPASVTESRKAFPISSYIDTNSPILAYVGY